MVQQKKGKNEKGISDEIVFNQCNPQRIEAFDQLMQEELQFFGYRDIYEPIITSIRDWLKDKKIMKINDQNELSPYRDFSSIIKSSKNDRDTYAKTLSYIFCNAYNTRLYLNFFPRNILMVTCKIEDDIWSTPSALLQFYQEIQLSPEIEDIHNMDKFCRNIPWLQVYYFKNRDSASSIAYQQKYYRINPIFSAAIHTALHEIKNQSVSHLEEKDGLHLFYTEKSFVEAFPTLLFLYQQKKIQFSASGKLSVSLLRDVQKSIGWNEFYPESKDNLVKNYRLKMALTYLISYFNNIKEIPGNGIGDVMRHCLKKLFLNDKQIFDMLLPHISGWKNIENKYNYIQEFLYNVNTAIKLSRPEENWISTELIYNLVLTSFKGAEYLHLCSLYTLYDTILKNKKLDNKEINASDFKETICKAAVKNWLVLLASLGIFDVAYRDFTDEDVSWVEGIQYIRMTKLGAYAMGVTNEYQSDDATQAIKYTECDPDRLIVTVIKDHHPHEFFLQEVGKDIGNHRYAFTYESFLKNCLDYKDLKQKIDFFKAHIDKGESPVWKSFFNTLAQRHHAIQEDKIKDYRLFHTTADELELNHLLCTDEKLKEYTIRAENYFFLVKEADYKKFTQRLKTFGFIL